MSALPVVVLRPEPGNSATMARLVALGVPATSAPLFVVEPLPWQPPADRGFDALLLTSANTVRLAGNSLSELSTLPVWCVGEATAAAARAVGLAVVRVGNADAATLIADGGHRLLWLCGEDRTQLPSSTEARVTAIPVYRVSECTINEAIFSRPCIALLHSASAARRLSALVPSPAAVTIVAISPAVATTAGHGWSDVAVASTPDDGEMVAIAAKLCQKHR